MSLPCLSSPYGSANQTRLAAPHHVGCPGRDPPSSQSYLRMRRSVWGSPSAGQESLQSLREKKKGVRMWTFFISQNSCLPYGSANQTRLVSQSAVSSLPRKNSPNLSHFKPFSSYTYSRVLPGQAHITSHHKADLQMKMTNLSKDFIGRVGRK